MVHELTLSGQPQTSSDRAAQEALRARGPIPRHIAIIMDGNGRWAQAHGQHRVFGHHEGVASVRDITEACAQIGVEHLTLYTFSTENWQRPEPEVSALMELLIHTIEGERETLLQNRIRLRALGDLSQLPPACAHELQQTIEATAGGDRLTLSLALSYSGRWEILNAARALAERVRQGALDPAAIDADAFEAELSTAGMPDPDLLIRTGGEQRISNYLLWQIAYTELYITDAFWPSFRREALYAAIQDYQDRDRRFGRVKTA